MELARNIRFRRLKSVSQIMRMKNETAALKGYIEKRRSEGRSRGRWL